ncbi:hypothetical protein F5I97DRAFT_1956827 [Phlebopus sp. FC_14]|nr:hypothetical protein F5I97DRAFT_1956827 [Phlebopus sp. FC_14]
MRFSTPNKVATCLACSLFFARSLAAPDPSDVSKYNQTKGTADFIKSAMLGSIRTSWEQGTAAGGILEWDDSEYSVFGSSPFTSNGQFPVDTLQLAYSAAVRKTPDGRLSQNIGDALDGAALDGASAGSAVLLGSFADTDSSRSSYWWNAAASELNYVCRFFFYVSRSSSRPISTHPDSERCSPNEIGRHFPQSRQRSILVRPSPTFSVCIRQFYVCRADGVYMGFPFIAYYGGVTNNQTLLQIAYDQCRLYRDALILDGPTGKLWGHIYDDDNNTWIDQGIWGTGNAWAALGIIRVAVTIQKTSFASSMTAQVSDLVSWVKEILDGELAALTSQNLVPDYLTDGPSFGDASSTGALASVAYRAATLWPDQFGSNYTSTAANMRDAVLGGITNLGTVSPVVNPLVWNETGLLSTEAQAFSLMMFSGWRDYLGVS